MSKLIDDFKSKIITIAEIPDSGKTALLIKVIKDTLLLNKKVLFFSLKLSEDSILKRLKIQRNKNLSIIDSPILSLEQIKKSIDIHDSNLIVLDYLEMLPNIEEIFRFLKQASAEKDIPIIITTQLNATNNIDLDMLISNNKSMKSILEESDIFSILYHKRDKEYMLKQLKNNYGHTTEVDIREFLN